MVWKMRQLCAPRMWDGLHEGLSSFFLAFDLSFGMLFSASGNLACLTWVCHLLSTPVHSRRQSVAQELTVHTCKIISTYITIYDYIG